MITHSKTENGMVAAKERDVTVHDESDHRGQKVQVLARSL